MSDWLNWREAAGGAETAAQVEGRWSHGSGRSMRWAAGVASWGKFRWCSANSLEASISKLVQVLVQWLKLGSVAAGSPQTQHATRLGRAAAGDEVPRSDAGPRVCFNDLAVRAIQPSALSPRACPAQGHRARASRGHRACGASQHHSVALSLIGAAAAGPANPQHTAKPCPVPHGLPRAPIHPSRQCTRPSC